MRVTQTMEKRQQTRREIAVEVDMTCDGARTPGLKTRNLSLSGVLLEPGDYALPAPGAIVDLNFHAPAAQNGGRLLRARVVRASSQGLGLLFRDFGLEDFGFIQGLIDGA